MKNAIVTKVSVSGANEKLDINDVINFLKRNPQAELGIPVSENIFYNYTAKMWIYNLCRKLDQKNMLHQACFHICGQWAYWIAKDGQLPVLLEEQTFKIPAMPLPKIQLNIGYERYNLNNLDPTPLSNLMEDLKTVLNENEPRLVLQTNEHSIEFAKKLQALNPKFCVLYDCSHGQGKVATSYSNNFPGLYQGYAGGLCAENIAQELAKIDAALGQPTEIWVDAEGKLKTDDGTTLDLAKAQAFVTAALNANNLASSNATSNADTNNSTYDQFIPLSEDEEDPWAKYEFGED